MATLDSRLAKLEHSQRRDRADYPPYIAAADENELAARLAELPADWRGHVYLGGISPDDWDVKP